MKVDSMVSEVPGALLCLSDADLDIPVHEKLYRRIRGLITSGALGDGKRFASSRTLAVHLGVSRNSVLKAVDRLIADGWLEAHRGSGVYVRHVSRRPPASRGTTHNTVRSQPFAPGAAPLDLFPYQFWNRLQSRRWKQVAGFELAKSHPLGVPALREAIAAHS